MHECVYHPPPHTHTRCQKLTHQNVKLKIFGLQDRVLEHKKGLVTLIYKVIKNSNDGHACKKTQVTVRYGWVPEFSLWSNPTMSQLIHSVLRVFCPARHYLYHSVHLVI